METCTKSGASGRERVDEGTLHDLIQVRDALNYASKGR